MSQQIKSVVPLDLRRRLTAGAFARGVMILQWLAMPSAGLAQCLNGRPAKLPSPGIKLVIRVDKPVFEISRPVIVHVELSNESPVAFSLTDRLFPERDYELHLRDSSGKEAPLTAWGNQIRNGPIKGSTTIEVLAPGEKHTDKEDLTRLYAITLQGEYTLEACRDVQGWGNIYSKRIKIGFVDAPPPLSGFARTGGPRHY